MAFYKEFQSKLNDLWYPRTITTGVPITIDKIADKLSLQSTVTRGDTYAMLRNLGGIIADCMTSGSTVKIDGIGTFYYTVATNENGVAALKKVTSGQTNGVRVYFIPRVKRSSGKQITTRSMVDTGVVWMDIEKLANGGTSGGGSSDPGGSGSKSGEEQDPLG